MVFKDFIYLFLEREKGREIERERNIDVRQKHLVASSSSALTRDQIEPGEPSPWGMTPNQLSHTKEGYEPEWKMQINLTYLLLLCVVGTETKKDHFSYKSSQWT